MAHDETPADLAGDAAGLVLLTPVDEATAPASAGYARGGSLGSAGLAVSADVVVEPAVADTLDGQRVWVSGRFGDNLVVFQAIARRSESDVLEMTGIAVPVFEARRAHVRAPISAPAEIIRRAGSEPVRLTGRSVDLSRGSCRVRMADEQPAISPGENVDLVLDLEGGPVHTRAEVLRTDLPHGEAVLLITGGDGADLARIDRQVFSRIGAT